MVTELSCKVLMVLNGALLRYKHDRIDSSTYVLEYSVCFSCSLIFSTRTALFDLSLSVLGRVI